MKMTKIRRDVLFIYEQSRSAIGKRHFADIARTVIANKYARTNARQTIIKKQACLMPIICLIPFCVRFGR